MPKQHDFSDLGEEGLSMVTAMAANRAAGSSAQANGGDLSAG